MDFNDLLEPTRVRVGVEASSKKNALEALSELIASAQESLGASRILEALFQRERLGCTSIGGGIALPHARIEGLKHPVGAFVRLTEAIGFEATDDLPVQYIFGMIVPRDTDGDGDIDDDDKHDPRLGVIAGRLTEPELSRLLAEATTDQEAYDALVGQPRIEQELEASA